MPPTLRGGTRAKVVDGLLAKGLVTDADGCHLLTDAGYAAVGKRRPAPKGVQKTDSPHALQKLEATPRTIHPGTKLAAIIDAMRHPGGATIAHMMAGTGWQAHTVRGAISGMVRKRLGYEVVTEKGGERTAGLPHRLTANRPRVCAHRRPFSSAKFHGGRFAIFAPEIAGNPRQNWPESG